MNPTNATTPTQLLQDRVSGAIPIRDQEISGFLTLAQASKILPRVNGKRINVSTIHRWIRRGLRGAFLQHWRIGRKVVVTQESLNRFFVALAQADKSVETSNTTSRKKKPRRTNSVARQKALDEANAVLVRAGIIKPTQITLN